MQVFYISICQNEELDSTVSAPEPYILNTRNRTTFVQDYNNHSLCDPLIFSWHDSASVIVSRTGD